MIDAQQSKRYPQPKEPLCQMVDQFIVNIAFRLREDSLRPNSLCQCIRILLVAQMDAVRKQDAVHKHRDQQYFHSFFALIQALCRTDSPPAIMALAALS